MKRLKLNLGETREVRGKETWIPDDNRTMWGTVPLLWQILLSHCSCGSGVAVEVSFIKKD